MLKQLRSIASVYSSTSCHAQLHLGLVLRRDAAADYGAFGPGIQGKVKAYLLLGGSVRLDARARSRGRGDVDVGHKLA